MKSRLNFGHHLEARFTGGRESDGAFQLGYVSAAPPGERKRERREETNKNRCEKTNAAAQTDKLHIKTDRWGKFGDWQIDGCVDEPSRWGQGSCINSNK